MPNEEVLNALLKTYEGPQSPPEPANEEPVAISPEMTERRKAVDELKNLRDNEARKIGVGSAAETYFKKFEMGQDPLTRFEVFEQTPQEERMTVIRKIMPHLTQEDLNKLTQTYSSQFVDVMVDKGVLPPEIMRQVEKNRQARKDLYSPLKAFHDWLERIAPRPLSPREMENDRFEKLRAKKHFDQEYFDFLNNGLETAIAKFTSPQPPTATA